MSNIFVPDLPVAITLDGSEQVPLVQPAGDEGTMKRATAGQIAALAGLFNYSFAAQSVFGNPTNLQGVGTAIIGSAGQIFSYDASGNLGFRTFAVTSSEITGIISVPNGGTGTSVLASGAILLGNGTSALSSVTVLTVPSGGSGASSLTANSVLLGNGTGAITVVTNGTTGFVLTSNGTGSAPTFQSGTTSLQINLSSTSAVTGILPVGFGGSGQTTLSAFGVVLGNGTSAVTIATAGSSGQILVGQTTTSQPIFRSATGDLTISLVGTATIATNSVGFFKIQQAQAFAVVGNSSSAVTNVTAILGTTDQVLRVNTAGTGLGFGQVNLSTSVAVTGVLRVTNGGVGTSALTASSLLIGNGTSAVTVVANTTAGAVLVSNGTASPPTFGFTGAPHAIVSEQQAQGIDGGSFTASIWTDRLINTETYDPFGLVNIPSTSSFTLGTGTYFMDWSFIARGCQGHQSRLFNSTDSSIISYSITQYAESFDLTTSVGSTPIITQNDSHGVASVAIAASKTFKVQHFCNVTHTNTGFGRSANITGEIYGRVNIWKLG